MCHSKDRWQYQKPLKSAILFAQNRVTLDIEKEREIQSLFSFHLLQQIRCFYALYVGNSMLTTTD